MTTEIPSPSRKYKAKEMVPRTNVVQSKSEIYKIDFTNLNKEHARNGCRVLKVRGTCATLVPHIIHHERTPIYATFPYLSFRIP